MNSLHSPGVFGTHALPLDSRLVSRLVSPLPYTLHLPPAPTRRQALAALCWPACLPLAGCSSLLPTTTPPPAYYTLQGRPATAGRAQARAPSTATADARTGIASTAVRAPLPRNTLVVLPPSAAAGYDSARILYTRLPHRLEYFARSEWVDTPARMLAPLLVAAFVRQGSFDAVVQAPSLASAGLRLETQVLRLQQEFDTAPSRVRFALRAQLIEATSLSLLATRDFEHSAASASEDPAGGVAAAQVAVQAVLDELVVFCAEAASRARAVAATAPAPAALASLPSPLAPTGPRTP